jgi:hypothetical protein
MARRGLCVTSLDHFDLFFYTYSIIIDDSLNSVDITSNLCLERMGSSPAASLLLSNKTGIHENTSDDYHALSTMM